MSGLISLYHRGSEARRIRVGPVGRSPSSERPLTALSRSSGRDRAPPVCDRNGHSSSLGSDLRRGGFASQSPKVIKSIRPADVSPERCHQCMPAFGQSNDGRPFLACRVGLPPALYTSRAVL